MGSPRRSGQAAGLAQVVFPDTTSLGGTYPQSGVTEATVSHVYTFTEEVNEEGVYEAAASDRATNVTTETFRLTRDAEPPQVWLDVSRRVYSGAASIPVTWGATDDTSGMARYDVQVRVEDGDWTTWLTDTLATEVASSLARVTKYYKQFGAERQIAHGKAFAANSATQIN